MVGTSAERYKGIMSTFTLDSGTSRATPSPVPGKRMTVPVLRARKVDGSTAEPIVMLTAYTMRMAQLLDPHCEILLVGDSLGQPVNDLPQTVPDEQYLAVRIEQLRHPHRVRGQHDDRLGGRPALLARPQRRNGHALAGNRRRGGAAGAAIDGESGPDGLVAFSA